MEKIMVVVDFSDGADRAMAEALRLAKRMSVGIDVVHVAPMPSASPSELVARSPLDLGAAEDARRGLAALAALAEGEGVAAQTHLRVGDVNFGLLDTIDELKPAMVVVGSHGKGALARMLLGSVSEMLCRRSAVPVVVVPSPRRRGAAERAAWSCAACGHILGDRQSSETCGGCGASPARWLSAPISNEPIDIAEPHVADGAPAERSYAITNDAVGLFATSAPGTEGCDVNPELRVRY